MAVARPTSSRPSDPDAPDEPFRFGWADLEPERASAGARQALAHFRHWCDREAGTVARHVELYSEQLEAARRGGRPAAAVAALLPRGRQAARRLRLVRELGYFVVYDLGEVPDPAVLDRLATDLDARVPFLGGDVPRPDPARGVGGVVESFRGAVPELAGLPGLDGFGERLDRLRRTLPEAVVRAGGLGKAVRAAAGVLAVAGYDTLDDDPAGRRRHLIRVLPSAYALGAAYVIVDDALHDLPGDHLPPADRERCHRAVLAALRSGDPADTAGLPDHPLVEELAGLHAELLASHPFADHRPLYHAAEAMYLAQHRDAALDPARPAPGGAVSSLYPDLLVKAGMSRVVATLLARRAPDERACGRSLATILLGQLKDDLRDREEDARAGRVTPFTVPAGEADVDPLHDLFAYDAYVAHQVFGGDPVAVDVLSFFGAAKLAHHLGGAAGRVERLVRDYPPAPEVAAFLRRAAGLPVRTTRRLEPADTRIKERLGAVLSRREGVETDARTFVGDRLPLVNEAIARFCPGDHATGLDRIVAYALAAGGKRLRPVLGLMLAESLGVDVAAVEPLVVASELFHTASLLFDDLPAQDGATVRRGRPAAHTVFDEGSVQLAAISMISSGFALLARLDRCYPAPRVTMVIDYVGGVLGPQRLCRGQDLDLHLGRRDGPVSGAEILEMYELKTSTPIEAALVPLMMLEGRPESEMALVREYARHAGIVFQLRDDLLDLTSVTAELGKDAGHDGGKVNAVRAYGPDEARRLVRVHLDGALACCARLPFDTRLLEGMVQHFADRRR